VPLSKSKSKGQHLHSKHQSTETDPDTTVNSLPPLLHQHVLHLLVLNDLARIITSPETGFEDAKLALERWLALSRGGERWQVIREWEELVDLELTGYGNGLEEDSEDSEEVRPRRKGKGKK
jgi:hypothetical protein